MSVISINKLNISYGNHKVLQDVTVNMSGNQIIAILGPSGCGKTTLLKSLNRLLDFNEQVRVDGDILIGGTNINDPTVDVIDLRKKVGFLSQRPFPLPMSIYDNIAFGPKLHRLSDEQVQRQVEEREKKHNILNGSMQDSPLMKDSKRNKAMDHLVEYYLRLAGLWNEVKDRLPAPASQLSIGQQQRLALARALAVEPEIILADEPTSALDPISAKLVENQFTLLKRDYTIIVVTHILRQARRLADYVIFLYMGELVEHGPSADFFNSPKDERTIAYIKGEIS
jgi:phosphate transport system ATP-binding protein